MSYLSDLQQRLTAEQYAALTKPLMYTANEKFGGQVQDYQAQLLLPLDTSKVQSSFELTPVKYETVYDGEGGSYQVKTGGVPVGLEPITEQRGDSGDVIVGYKTPKPVNVNGAPVYAEYDANGQLTGYTGDQSVRTWVNGKQSISGKWDATGKPAPNSYTSTNNGFRGLLNDVMSDPVLGTVSNIAAAYFGGPLGTAALGAAQGKSPEDIAKAAALSYAAGQVAPVAANATGSVVAGQFAGNTASGLLSGQDLESSLTNAAINTGANQAAGGLLSAGQPEPTPYVPPTDYSTGVDYSLTGNTGGLGLQATRASLDMSNPYSFDTNYAATGGLGFSANLAPFNPSNPYSLETNFGNLASMGGGQGITIPNQQGATLGSIGAQAEEQAQTPQASSNNTQTLLGNLLKSALLGSQGTGNMATTNTNDLGGLIGGLLRSTGGLMQGSTNTEALQQAADSLRQTGQQAATASQFRPVGTTTRFGTSNFQVDPATGQLVSAGYNASGLAQGYQDQLAGMTSQGLMQGQQIQGLANQYLGESPDAVRQRYIQQQTALLAPGNEQKLAETRNNLFQTGRTGLATGATTAGDMAATNPEMAAYYNALANQQRQLAAGADVAAQNQIKFGQGLAADAYSPFTSGFGAQGAVEKAAQQPLGLSTDLGTLFQQANAQGAKYNLAAQDAATKALMEKNTYNPYAQLLSGSAGNQQLTGALGGLLGSTGLGQSIGNLLGGLNLGQSWTGSPNGLDTSNIDYNYLSQIYSGGNPYAGTTWDGE